MAVTIQLNDALASQLKIQASARQLSLDQFAQHLLGDALEHLQAAEQWQVHNRRRLALIRKSSTAALSHEEEAELQHLQAGLDQRLEPLDNELLEGMHRLEQAARRLEDGEGQ